MWLLNAHTRELENFEGDNIPPYVIVSHRWEGDEVTFEDVRQGTARLKKGYRKVDFSCKQAIHDLAHDVESGSKVYIWIDTCCINKSDSAELSEAINSMYEWYQNALICYAYLSDVFRRNISQFQKSAWFSRGWTLQELLAPKDILFFDCQWNFLGRRYGIKDTIARITGIPVSAFEESFQPGLYTAAEKLSWAARRHTTRKEDTAYCLLRIFEVSMPLIYGEGERAFRRFQEIVLQRTADLTIFAWSEYLCWLPKQNVHGLFARSPGSFVYPSGRLRRFRMMNARAGDENREGTRPGQVYSLADSETELTLYLVPFAHNMYLVPILYIGEQLVGMALERWIEPNEFRRMCAGQKSLFNVSRESLPFGKVCKVNIDNYEVRVGPEKVLDLAEECSVVIEEIKLGQDENWQTVSVFSRDRETAQIGNLVLSKGMYGIVGFVQIATPGMPMILLHLGFDFDLKFFCLATLTKGKSGEKHTLENARPSLPDMHIHGHAITSNRDIMKLVSAMQADSIGNWLLKESGVELHQMSFGKGHEIFKIGNLANVRVSQTGSLYSIFIHVFSSPDLPGAESHLDETKDAEETREWFAHRWPGMKASL